MSSPFDYPLAPLVRRHKPRGYERAASYRPWLRDEFSFRCVFCLVRETWLTGDLDVEHFEPASRSPHLASDYVNLMYACHTCNLKKSSGTVPDPCIELVRREIFVQDNGLMVTKSKRARELMQALGLNSRRQRQYRQMMISIIELAEQYDPKLFRHLMGYPDDLPNLSTLRPPGGNGKPDGVTASHFARRERGELPDTY